MDRLTNTGISATTTRRCSFNSTQEVTAQQTVAEEVSVDATVAVAAAFSHKENEND